MSPIALSVFHNLKNIALTGAALLISSIAGNLSRQQCSKTLDTILKDFRNAKITLKDMKTKSVG